MQSPFDNPACPTPGPAGDFQGTRGGYDDVDSPAQSQDTMKTPYDKPSITTVGKKETAGKLPNLPTIDSFTGDTPPGQQDVSSYTANRVWPASRK